MCGICGWVDYNRRVDYNYNKLSEMTNALFHRGPDEYGLWINDNIALGHRRLSIIDLARGKQPMVSNNGNVITFNGEIYNYKEIREEIVGKGYGFKTESDTEVLLKAYECWGEACLDKLIGMFSFAIWNPRSRELFLARDHLGKKPLYYYASKSLFAFSSEIKSLLTIDEIRQNIEIDVYSISDYLSLGYILTPKTIFKNIHRLQAGYYAVYKVDGGNFELNKYWNLEDCYLPVNNLGYNNEMNGGFLEIFNDAVKIRMRSDVPLGSFLSGGIDSSSVTAFMAKNSQNRIQSFCIGFNKNTYNESLYAKLTAEYLNVDLLVDFYNPLSDKELSKLIWHFDEPFADNSFIPTYQLNKIAKRHITVALSGDGADEILAGYPTYIADKLFKIYSTVFSLKLQKEFSKIADRIVRPSYKKVGLDYRTRQFLRGYGLSREEAHYWWRVIYTDDEKKMILNPDIYEKCKDYNPFDIFKEYFMKVRHASFLDQTLYVDIKTWLQDDILVKIDRMSMANSFEVRSPFLDYRIVEYMAKMPISTKIRRYRQKVILKNCMKQYLPKRILERPKRGFNTPIDIYNNIKLENSVLFSDKYRFNIYKEDVSFKYFSLKVLKQWFEMYENYKKTGRWEPIEYT